MPLDLTLQSQYVAHDEVHLYAYRTPLVGQLDWFPHPKKKTAMKTDIGTTKTLVVKKMWEVKDSAASLKHDPASPKGKKATTSLEKSALDAQSCPACHKIDPLLPLTLAQKFSAAPPPPWARGFQSLTPPPPPWVGEAQLRSQAGYLPSAGEAQLRSQAQAARWQANVSGTRVAHRATVASKANKTLGGPEGKQPLTAKA